MKNGEARTPGPCLAAFPQPRRGFAPFEPPDSSGVWRARIHPDAGARIHPDAGARAGPPPRPITSAANPGWCAR
jgi:hypothetical protein